MGLLQVVRLAPPPTFYDIEVASKPPALSSSMGLIAGWQDELAFAALRLAYAASGGIARGDDLGRLLADHGPGTFISITKLLEDEEVFGFEWKTSLWIPMFQFGREDLSLKSEATQGSCGARRGIRRLDRVSLVRGAERVARPKTSHRPPRVRHRSRPARGTC